jgi:hypothetical protein
MKKPKAKKTNADVSIMNCNFTAANSVKDETLLELARAIKAIADAVASPAPLLQINKPDK